MIKLHDKEFTLQVRTGLTSSLSSAGKSTVIGELLFCHDTGQLYIAQDSAGASDSILFQIPAVSGTDVNHSYAFTGTFNNTDGDTVTVQNGIIVTVA